MTTSTHCQQTPNFFPSIATQHNGLPAMRGQSRIAYFITRTNGTPVPLIPADELPYSVKLQHVPRVLTPDQTYGLKYIGNSPYTGTTFQLEQASTHTTSHRFECHPSDAGSDSRSSCNLSARQFQAPDSLIRQSSNRSNNLAAPSSTPGRPVSKHGSLKSWRRPDPMTPTFNAANDSAESAQNAINAILHSQAGAETAERIGYRSLDSIPGPSGRIPDQEKKEWCTYWILHGDCAYVQQGCRYRHEMPNKAKLAEIGINHVPRWWLEQNSAVKIGSDRVAWGPAVKPNVWLKTRRGSDGDSESSSADSARSQSTQHNTTSKVISTPEVKPVNARLSPSVVQTRSFTPTELLIDFIPLIPTPSTSAPSISSPTTTNSTTPTSEEKVSRQSSRAISNLAPIKFDCAAKIANTATSTSIRSPPESSAKPVKVFVPAGESPEIHIADSKKRTAARNKASRTPSPTTKSNKTGENLEKLIREMRKNKGGGTEVSPFSHALLEQSQECVKRKAKAGCRERRPIPASPPTPVMKK